MDDHWTGIALATLSAMLILLAEHYWPKRRMEPPWTYVLGVLGIYLPLSALLLAWREWWSLAAIWIAAAGGGLMVCASYLVDHFHEIMIRLGVAEKEGKTLREVLDGKDEERP